MAPWMDYHLPTLSQELLTISLGMAVSQVSLLPELLLLQGLSLGGLQTRASLGQDSSLAKLN